MLALSTRQPTPASVAVPLPREREAMLERMHFHSLTSPPVLDKSSAATSSRTGGVWSASIPDSCGKQLLTRRHLALQAMQLKIDILLGRGGALWNPALRLFIDGELDHLYVDASSFAELACTALGGVEPKLPSFIDAKRECVVIDPDRFFHPASATLTTQAFQALVAMGEAPNFAMAIRRYDMPIDGSRPRRAEVIAMHHCAHAILRHSLQEPGLALSPLSQQLRDRLSSSEIAQAVLGGAPQETARLTAAFSRLWTQRAHRDRASQVTSGALVTAV